MHAVSTGDGGPRIAILLMQHEVICTGVEPHSSDERCRGGYPEIDFRYPFFCGNAHVRRKLHTLDGSELPQWDGGAYDAALTDRPAAREAFEHILRMDAGAFSEGPPDGRGGPGRSSLSCGCAPQPPSGGWG